MKPDLLLIGGITERMQSALEAEFTLHPIAEMADSNAFLAQKGRDIQAVCTNGHDGVPAEFMDLLPNLKIISNYGVGYDAIDTEKAVANGVMVTHTPDVLNADVANTAILLMLAASRQLLRDDAYVRSGRWANEGNSPLTRSLDGKKVGILGLGRIGKTLAQKLQAFDCEVHYHGRKQQEGVDYTFHARLIDMSESVDYLVVMTPGGAETNKLVNADVLSALGSEGTLINVSRGTVVDETAMISALSNGQLGAAGLDVFENEPQVPEALCQLDNVVLLPHVGSATLETRQAMGDLTVENLVRYFAGEAVRTPVPECAHMIA